MHKSIEIITINSLLFINYCELFYLSHAHNLASSHSLGHIILMMTMHDGIFCVMKDHHITPEHDSSQQPATEQPPTIHLTEKRCRLTVPFYRDLGVSHIIFDKIFKSFSYNFHGFFLHSTFSLARSSYKINKIVWPLCACVCAPARSSLHKSYYILIHTFRLFCSCFG